jgi:hypothetical protein
MRAACAEFVVESDLFVRAHLKKMDVPKNYSCHGVQDHVRKRVTRRERIVSVWLLLLLVMMMIVLPVSNCRFGASIAPSRQLFWK